MEFLPFYEIFIENFLLPGFKILANSLENTCKGFHFSGSTAGWKHETLQNWTPSQVFVKDFAEIFSNYERFENPLQQMSLINQRFKVSCKWRMLFCTKFCKVGKCFWGVVYMRDETGQKSGSGW